MKSSDYEWDPDKARENLRKHGVRFSQAAMALRDDFAVTRLDPESNGEARYLSLSMDPLGHVLVTVFTHRGTSVRIISSRKATRSERRGYRQR